MSARQAAFHSETRPVPRRVFALALCGVLLLFGLIPPGIASASVLRAFAVRYTSNQPGDITMAANTLETCPPSALCTTALNGTATGANLNDNNYAMIFVDTDSDPTTFDSSTADLNLPAGATVLFAGLYWAGTTVGPTAPPNVAAKGTVLFQVPGGTYQTVTSTQTDSDPASPNSYQGFANVTSLVLAAGGGTYAVADVQAARGANMDAGWDLVVAYGDPSLPARNLTVFDGLAVINSPAAPVDISVSGFTTPPSGAVNTKLGVFGMDGDLGSTGDALSLNGTVLSNGLNPPDNFWNSTVSNLGTSVTSRNPNDINTLGLDADIVSANGILANSATSATIHLTTGGETYWPGVVTFVTDLYAPKITPTKTVTDLNGGTVQRGDTLEYTVDAANTGEDAAGGVVVTDPIPANTTYVPGSLVVLTGPNAGAKSDSSGNDQAEFDSGGHAVVFRLGTGADGTTGGTLAAVGHPNDQSSFRFRVTIDPAAPADTTISNLAQADYFGVTLGPSIPFTGSASAPTTTTVADADLAVSKTVDNPDPAVGDVFTYTIVVSNNGPASSAATVVSDPVPAGTTFVAASTSSGSYVSSSGTWTVGTLLPGASATLTLQVRLGATGPITNTVTASSATPDPNPANNTASVTTPNGLADLVVTKIVSVPSAPVGSNVTFIVGLHNSGPVTATTIRLADLLPAGLTFVSATPSVGSYTSGAGIWAISSLASGASASLALVATVTGASPATNVAQVVSLDQVDPDPSNSTASATVDGLTADLGLTKTVNNANPVVGNTIIYTVTVTNNGPAAAAGTVVSDPIPSGLAFVSATPSTGSYSAVTGSWSVGTLASGASATLAIHVTVTASGHITNTATVSSSVPDPDPGNNQASVTVPNLVADLSLTKSVAPPATPIGSNVVYTLTLANAGPAAATNVAVHELLPAGLAFVSATPSSGTYDSSTGSWLVPTLASGSSATLDITATVLTPGSITNTAQITALDESDPTSANGSASATVTGQAADLSVTKSVDDPTPNLGDSVTFTVQVANAGPDTAPSVQLSDPLPAGLTFTSATPSTGTYTALTGSWDVGSIASGTTDTLTIHAVVNATGSIKNVAQVSASGLPDPDSTPGNNVVGEDDEAIVSLAVPPAADLSLTKTVGSTDGVVGQPMTFHINLTNSGPDTATNVVVADALPAGLAFVSGTASIGAYNPGTGNWTVASLTASTTAHLTIVATVTATGPGTNTAEVIASDQFDPDSTPNNHDPAEDDQASVSFTRRLASADLSLTKTVSPTVVRIGSNAVFTIVVSNAGPDDATGVSVRDLLGAGFSFVSASGPGSYVHGTGIWTIGTITSGSSATLLLTAKMTEVGAASNTAQVWTSDEPDPNSTPGNGVVGENDEATAALTVTAAPTPPVTANGGPIVPADPQDPSGVLLLGGLVMAFAVAAGLAYRSRRRSIRHAGWTPRRR
jgi:large repetitive protein